MDISSKSRSTIARAFRELVDNNEIGNLPTINGLILGAAAVASGCFLPSAEVQRLHAALHAQSFGDIADELLGHR